MKNPSEQIVLDIAREEMGGELPVTDIGLFFSQITVGLITSVSQRSGVPEDRVEEIIRENAKKLEYS